MLMADHDSTTSDGESRCHAWVHEAVIALADRADPRAVGGAVTVALCGHWEHDGPCRWPHNNELVDDVFRTLFVCEPREEPAVRALISSALRSASEWRVVSERERPISAGEQELALNLLRVPRKKVD